MDEYVARNTAKRWLAFAVGTGVSAVETIDQVPAADVAPVVHCRECEHSYEAVGGRVCTYGVCVDCEVTEDFFCSYGKRKEE